MTPTATTANGNHAPLGRVVSCLRPEHRRAPVLAQAAHCVRATRPTGCASPASAPESVSVSQTIAPHTGSKEQHNT